MTELATFELEEYLAQREFSSPYLLCCSDSQSLTLQEILSMANEEELNLWNNLSLGYTEPYGHPILRKRITEKLYPSLSADNILCFAGAEEGIYASLKVLCKTGDHVIVLTPCYQSLYEVPRSQGSEITSVILREENDWRIDLNSIEKAIKPNTKCIVINFPHNPTGQVITQEELMALVTLCKKHDIWIFSDEVYRLLGALAKPWSDPAACVYPKAISLGVMSKTFGMPGARIGWIACQDKKILHEIRQVKDYLSICNSAPAEILSMIVLRNKDAVLARNNKIVADNLKLLDEFFVEYNHLFSWVRPQGGCVGFVEYKGPESIDDFTKHLLKSKGVLLLPSSVYGPGYSHFRIGFGRKNMPEVLNQFRSFLTKA